MTAICPSGGPSAAKAGYGATVQISTFALGALANNWPVAWAVAYAALLGAVNWDLNTMCVTDPPADPGFTATDAQAMLASYADPLAFAVASAKLGQLLQRYGWYQFCECTGGSTPAPPAPPSAPIGLPTIAPNVTTSNTPCGTLGPVTGTSTNGSIVDVEGNHFSTPGVYVPIPAGATTVKFTCTTVTVSGATDTSGVRLSWGDSASNRIGAVISVAEPFGPNATANVQLSVPSGAAGVNVWIFKTNGTTGVQDITVSASFYCGSAPGGIVGTPGTCQPDLATLGMLQQILDLVTLIQRQDVPFAYVTGTSHTGISGNGTIAVQGILGLKIAFTVKPSRLGVDVGDPNNLWGAGWINLGTADGFGQRIFVTSDPQIVKPISGDVTVIGYSIPTDCTLTITELRREP